MSSNSAFPVFRRALSLVFSFSITLCCHTAFSATLPDGVHSTRPLPSNNPSAALYGQDDSRPRLVESLQKESVTESVDLTGATLTKSFVPTFTCTDLDNTDYASLWGGLSFLTSGAIGGIVTEIGNRYDVQPGFICSLSGVWMFLGVLKGDIDGEIGVWSGAFPNANVPATQVASVVANSTTLSSNAWNFFDLSGLGLTFTEDFFVTFGTVIGSAVDAGGPGSDTIQVILDNVDGSTVTQRTGVTFDASRSSWTTNDIFWTQYHNQVASAVVCCQEIPFTNCSVEAHSESYAIIFKYLPKTAYEYSTVLLTRITTLCTETTGRTF